MVNDKHFSENDRLFYADGYRIAQTAINQGITEENLFAAIELLYEAIDGLNDSIIAYSEKQHVRIACRKGCHWCCHQAVFANSYEIHYLAAQIKKIKNDVERRTILEKANEKSIQTSKLSDEEVLKYKHPCPFLSAGACSLYRARPMACRIYLSFDLESCLEFYHHPENEHSYPALLEFPLRAGRMMNEGFMAALKAGGIDTAEFRLEEGLRIALQPVR